MDDLIHYTREGGEKKKKPTFDLALVLGEDFFVLLFEFDMSTQNEAINQ